LQPNVASNCSSERYASFRDGSTPSTYPAVNTEISNLFVAGSRYSVSGFFHFASDAAFLSASIYAIKAAYGSGVSHY